MKKKLCVFLLVMVNLLSMMSSIQASQSKEPSYFKASEIQSWKMSPEAVLKKYGKTLDGKSKISDIYKNEDFSIKYDGISFVFTSNKKLYFIEITSPKYTALRGIKVGTSAREVLKKFPCDNKIMKEYCNNSKAKLSSINFDDYGYYTMNLWFNVNEPFGGTITKRTTDGYNDHLIFYYDYDLYDYDRSMLEKYGWYQEVAFIIKNDKVSSIEIYFRSVFD